MERLYIFREAKIDIIKEGINAIGHIEIFDVITQTLNYTLTHLFHS